MATGDITFAVRGDSTDAFRSFSGKTGGKVTGREASVVDAGAIGGSTLDLDITGSPNPSKQHLLYNGRNSVPATQGISVLIRAKIGTSATLNGLFTISVPFNNNMSKIGMYYRRDTDKLFADIFNEDSGGRLVNTDLGLATPLDDDQYHDIVLTDTGDDTDGALKVYVDGTLLYTSGVLSNQMATPKPVDRYTLIALGYVHGVNSSGIIVNEFVVFEGVIDPTNVTLEDPDTGETSTGSLEGPTRTKWVNCEAFDGFVPSTNYTDPGASNVLEDVTYQFEGQTQTGTLVQNKTSKVRIIV